VLHCRDYQRPDSEDKETLFTLQKYEVPSNREAAVTELGLFIDGKFDVKVENGEMWLIRNDIHGRPWSDVILPFSRMHLYLPAFRVEVQLHPLSASSPDNRDLLFLPIDNITTIGTTNRTPTGECRPFTRIAIFVRSLLDFSLHQQQALMQMTGTHAAAKHRFTHGHAVCDFLSYVHFCQLSEQLRLSSRQSLLEAMLEREPVSTSRILYE
jgi:hypothetical protein